METMETNINIKDGDEGEKKMHEHNHEQEKNEMWEKSQENEIVKKLKNGESFQEIVSSLENIKEAFMDLDTIVCSDGRVLPSEGAKLGIAGEGILLDEEALNCFVEKNKGKIKKVTSHDDCGAAGIAFSQDKKGKQKADDLGMEFAQYLAGLLGAEYEHIPMEKMRNTIHDERFIFFDGTGKFNPAVLKEMPGHFVSSGYGLGLSEDYLKDEVKALAGIALGDHGFGKRFNSENPFRIVISASDDEQLKKLTELGKSVADQFEGRVVVDGFIA